MTFACEGAWKSDLHVRTVGYDGFCIILVPEKLTEAKKRYVRGFRFVNC